MVVNHPYYMNLFYSLYFSGLFIYLSIHVSYGQIPTFGSPQPTSLGQYGQSSISVGQPIGNTINPMTADNERIRRQNEALIQASDAHIEQQRRYQQTQQELYQDIENSFPGWKREQQIVYAKGLYTQAYQKLVSILNGQAPTHVKEAVFTVENTFLENTLTREGFEKPINYLLNRCRQQMRLNGDSLSPLSRYLALYQVLCDTITHTDPNGRVTKTLPLSYDFDDYLGANDHRQMFVSKLLQTGTGNCHSMPLLYNTSR